MSWTCAECKWEWDNVWQFFYIDDKKLCLACETDLTIEDREKGEFKKIKQQQQKQQVKIETCLTCPCNNKTYATLAKLKAHKKTKGHLTWENTS